MTRKRLNKNKVLQDIESTRGNLAAIARAYGITRQAVQKFVSQDPELVEATNEARESKLDEAEDKLYTEAIEKGNTAALIFLLKTQGKGRGYIENVRTELTGANGGPVQAQQTIEVRAIDYRNGLANLAPRSVSDSLPPSEDEGTNDGAAMGQNGAG
jgi:hypothetical protein